MAGGGGGGGWVVGKSDFNENAVVSLDFDLGFVNFSQLSIKFSAYLFFPSTYFEPAGFVSGSVI